MRVRVLGFVVAVGLIVAALDDSGLRAQSPGSPLPPLPAVPSAEVLASVKQHKPGDTTGSPVRILNDRFTATNYPPRGLITQAYQLQTVELFGVPAWMT